MNDKGVKRTTFSRRESRGVTWTGQQEQQRIKRAYGNIDKGGKWERGKKTKKKKKNIGKSR